MIGIYKITSPIGKIYVGQSRNIRKRISRYKNLQCKDQIKLYRSIIKYGWDKHVFEILEKCLVEDLNKRERYYQDKYDVLSSNGLNLILTPTEDLIRVYSIETRNKQSLSHTGKPMLNITRERIKEANQIKVIDTTTFRIFNSIKEAAEYNNIKYLNLMRKLKGITKNNTSLTYLKSVSYETF